jgi:transcriptional regulator with XRE-family HTH domain
MDGGGTAIGERIRRLREQRGLSATELASRCGVSVSAISKVETGSRALSSDLRERIAGALDLHPDSLLDAAPGRLRRVPLVGWGDLLKVALKGVPTGGEFVAADVEGERLIAFRLLKAAAPELPPGALVIADLADDALVEGRFYLTLTNGGLGGRIPSSLEILRCGDDRNPWYALYEGQMSGHGGHPDIILGRILEARLTL